MMMTSIDDLDTAYLVDAIARRKIIVSKGNEILLEARTPSELSSKMLDRRIDPNWCRVIINDYSLSNGKSFGWHRDEKPKEIWRDTLALLERKFARYYKKQKQAMKGAMFAIID